uniref:SFRICE_014708 n=1 Tax=Spodoptera frugiperda TaxID=7108 RepID=A0A2H1VR75_SPOFR
MSMSILTGLTSGSKGFSLLIQLCQIGRSLISARGMELYNLHSSVPLALIIKVNPRSQSCCLSGNNRYTQTRDHGLMEPSRADACSGAAGYRGSPWLQLEKQEKERGGLSSRDLLRTDDNDDDAYHKGKYFNS